ncbi:MAG: hypothetical protein AB7D36_07240 [Oscillospiraceae bacterium]
MIVFIIPSFIIIALLDLPGLIKNKYWLELGVYLAIFLAALLLSILLSVGIKIPSPTILAQHLIKDVLHLNFQ